MLKLENVQSGYGNKLAIKDVSLTIEEGEIITLIGANGAGKSTTLMTICNVINCRAGSVKFQGNEIHKMTPDAIVKLGICQVPEGRHIFPQLSVKENLDMGAFLRNDTNEIKKDLDYVYSLFPILAERRHQEGGNLSGGEQQMLAMSRALMARPKLMLLDEPSMGLAPLVIKQIFEIIKQINDESNTTIFLVEQNANQALHIADRGYVMENGRITLSGPAQELLENTDIQKAYLGI